MMMVPSKFITPLLHHSVTPSLDFELRRSRTGLFCVTFLGLSPYRHIRTRLQLVVAIDPIAMAVR
jgi:hypothetical protein